MRMAGARRLRRLAAQLRRDILAEGSLKLLLDVADQLFSGEYLEERTMAIELLKKDVGNFGDREFRRFEKWLPRVLSWADHDGLVYYLIGPMLVADSKRVRRIYGWAKFGTLAAAGCGGGAHSRRAPETVFLMRRRTAVRCRFFRRLAAIAASRGYGTLFCPILPPLLAFAARQNPASEPTGEAEAGLKLSAHSAPLARWRTAL